MTHDIDRLLAIMAQLRTPGTGCPWDLQQTFSTIAPYTIEEAHEVADAIDRGDLHDLKDELGDLLLQVVFHARMAQEQDVFDFGDVVEAISDKMTRRHPHVFAGTVVKDDEALGQLWEAEKKRERIARYGAAHDDSALAGVTRGLPAAQRAVKLQKKAAAVGFDWPSHTQVIEKLQEEIEEVRAEFDARAAAPDDPAVQSRLEDELGDLLFVAVNLARHAKVDPDTALRRASLKFERRFHAMEVLARADGTEFAALDLAAQERYWARAKALDA